jgi:hypothetical protein
MYIHNRQIQTIILAGPVVLLLQMVILQKKTCCWTERVPGKLPPNNKVNYCQTCTSNTAEGTQNCNNPQQQLRPSSSGTSTDENVLEQPQTLPQGPSGPLQQGGVLENQQ